MLSRQSKLFMGSAGAVLLMWYMLKAKRKSGKSKSERQSRLSRPLRWRIEQYLSAHSLCVGYYLRLQMYRQLASASSLKKGDLEDNAKCFFLGKDNRPQPHCVHEKEAERFVGVHIGSINSPELLDLVKKLGKILDTSFGKDVVFMHDPRWHHITLYAFSRREEVVSLEKVGRTVEDEMQMADSVIARFPSVRVYLQDIVLTSTGVVVLLWNQSVCKSTTNIDGLRASFRSVDPSGPAGQTQRITHTTLARIVALRPLEKTRKSDLHETRNAIRECANDYIGKISLDCRDVFYCQETSRLSHTGRFWSKQLGTESSWKRLS